MKHLLKSKGNAMYGVRVAVITLLLISIFLGLSSCSKKQLSRGEAEKMIITNEGFPAPVLMPMSLRPAVAFRNNVPQLYQQLQDAGVITYQYVTATAWLESDSLDIQLTEEGKKYLIRRENEKLVYLKACEKVFLKVTGIVSNETGTPGAKVDYEWTTQAVTPFNVLADMSDFEKPMFLNIPTDCQNAGTPQQATAKFALYDDGWRIVKE